MFSHFATLAELLGSEAAPTRLAAVSALATLGDDWPAARQLCADVLCGYLRLPFDTERANANREELLIRETALRAIAARLQPVCKTSWHACDFDFTDATLPAMDFSNSTFSGRVTFSHATFLADTIFDGTLFLSPVSFRDATFNGTHTYFEEVKFASSTDFSNAEFHGREVSFARAVFTGPLTAFHGATIEADIIIFSGAILSSKLVDFRDSVFRGSELMFDDAEFVDALVSFDSAHLFIDHISFSGASLSAATVDLRQANISEAILQDLKYRSQEEILIRASHDSTQGDT